MTETGVAGKHVKKFVYKNTAGCFARSHKILMQFAKYFFIVDHPRDASDWDSG
ncbi:MAG TPA: hypothetical protein PL029_12140 [Bacteroidia bacterium]|nr:hypothetical protein [Bacteroidia bacterium]